MHLSNKCKWVIMLNGMFWLMLRQYGENSDRENLSQIEGWCGFIQ